MIKVMLIRWKHLFEFCLRSYKLGPLDQDSNKCGAKPPRKGLRGTCGSPGNDFFYDMMQRLDELKGFYDKLTYIDNDLSEYRETEKKYNELNDLCKKLQANVEECRKRVLSKDNEIKGIIPIDTDYEEKLSGYLKNHCKALHIDLPVDNSLNGLISLLENRIQFPSEIVKSDIKRSKETLKQNAEKHQILMTELEKRKNEYDVVCSKLEKCKNDCIDINAKYVDIRYKISTYLSSISIPDKFTSSNELSFFILKKLNEVRYEILTIKYDSLKELIEH